MRRTVITNCDSFFITKCDTVYYKLRQVLQSAMDLLQIATGITNCDDYYKLRQYRWHPTLGHFTTALGQPLPWSLACSRVPFHMQPELLQCIPRFLVSASRLTFRCNRSRWKVSRQTGHGAVFDAALSERETIECKHFMHPECPHARLTGFIITSKLQLIQIQ